MKKIIALFICLTFTTFASNLSNVEKREAQEGAKYFKEVLKTAKISNDRHTLNKIKKIGMKIAKETKKDYDWEFVLVEKDVVNAFCLPGGKIIVYTGMMSIIQNDDQLATVISHEVAHVLLRHGGIRGKMNMILSMPKVVGKATVGQFIPPMFHGVIEKVYDTGKDITMMKPFGRNQEREADRVGLQLMHKAGFEIDEAVTLWENMSRMSTNNTPEFLSTHPNYTNRIMNIKKEINRLKI